MLSVRRAGNMWMVNMKRNPGVGILGKNTGATTVMIPNRTILEIFQQVLLVITPVKVVHFHEIFVKNK